MGMQRLVLRQVALPGSVDVAPRGWRTEWDVRAGVGLPKRKAEGRWPVGADFHSAGGAWRCSAALAIACRSPPSCLHLPLQPGSCPLVGLPQ